MMKRSEVILELYQMPGLAGRAIASRDNGHIDHMTFDVDDIDPVDERKWFRLLRSPRCFSNSGSIVNIVGPDGERLKFNQILS